VGVLLGPLIEGDYVQQIAPARLRLQAENGPVEKALPGAAPLYNQLGVLISIPWPPGRSAGGEKARTAAEGEIE